MKAELERGCCTHSRGCSDYSDTFRGITRILVAKGTRAEGEECVLSPDVTTKGPVRCVATPWRHNNSAGKTGA